VFHGISLKLNNKGTKVVRELDTDTIVGVQHIEVPLHFLPNRFDLGAGGGTEILKEPVNGFLFGGRLGNRHVVLVGHGCLLRTGKPSITSCSVHYTRFYNIVNTEKHN
jgi:hypothetical protein